MIVRAHSAPHTIMLSDQCNHLPADRYLAHRRPCGPLTAIAVLKHPIRRLNDGACVFLHNIIAHLQSERKVNPTNRKAS